MTENINSLVNTYAFLPLLPSHLLNRLPQHGWAVLSKLQRVILSLDVHFQLILAKEWQVFVEEDIHAEAYSPDISCPAGIAITACKLMLWSSESWGTCGEIGDIVAFSVSDSSKVDYLDLIASIRCLPAEDIVDFDISVSDSFIMQVLYPLADLQEDDSRNITHISRPILIGDVLHDLRVSIVTQIQLIPIHDLAQIAQLVDSDDLITTIHNLRTPCDVFVVQPFQDVELVVEHVQTVRELAIRCKETMFLQPYC